MVRLENILYLACSLDILFLYVNDARHLMLQYIFYLCNHFSLVFFCREGDSFDMRKKLPFGVGLLLRLLKKNHRVFVTCTTGFDRSPACVIAYLHWMTDTSLHAAYNFVTGLHTCRPDRFLTDPLLFWYFIVGDAKEHLIMICISTLKILSYDLWITISSILAIILLLAA